ncbi:unnamed protein product [Rotaria socialis]|uniref:Death ligand signal enhancer n=1 Tax=Rotaria socialis TaxID=392032 RepID=A0A821JBT8_9BILA|nr:unnamed protein product [Rotaria socialis]CAF4716091.1 unnamed protein product [Rotaria socialis]
MWRLANCFYRAFRNTATHRYSQDIVVPTAAVHKEDDDDDESIRTEKQENLIKHKHDFDCIVKTTRYAFENFEKLQKSLYKNSLLQLILKLNAIKPIQLSKVECTGKQAQTTSSNQKEETLNSSLQTDEDCLKSLAELNKETISIVNNELAMEAFEEGNVSLGIETLQMSAKDGKNSAALYNLGICYEQGIGIEKDLMKACDYYRQAASLGHANAFINLTLLSNHIDTDEEEEEEDTDENIHQTIADQSYGFRFSFPKQCKEEQSQLWNDYALDLSKTIVCLL